MAAAFGIGLTLLILAAGKLWRSHGVLLSLIMAGLVWVTVLFLTDHGPAFGWGSTIAALLVFSGTQMVVLGLIGEYLGRACVSINRRPQAVVRKIRKSRPEDS